MIGINAFQFFLLVSLSFLVNELESISRHRHTFFFEEDSLDAFTEDAIQILGKHAVRVGNFSGVREWKVTTTPEELMKSVTRPTVWNENWTLRVQIASGTQTLFYPFNIVPVPGIHIGISLGNQTFSERPDYKNMDFLAICKYLDALLGIVMCDKEQSSYYIDLSNSNSLPGGNIYYHSPILPYHKIPSPSSVLGRESYSKERRSPATIIDLRFNFDKKINKTKADLRMIWKCRNQNIEINNQDIQDDKVELGVFADLGDLESFAGARVVFGSNDTKPTMISIPPRILPKDSFFFSSSISPSQSFHPFFSTSIKYSVMENNCEDYILYTLPNSFFVDIYQLKDMFSNEQIKVWGETDLESPFGVTSLKWGSLILITRQSSENLDNFEFSLPLHMRYQPAIFGNIQRNHVFTTAPWPFVIRVCENTKNEMPEPLFAPTPLPLSLLFPSTTEIKYVLPKQRDTFWPKEAVKVPVGQSSHLKFVEWWTIIIVLTGCAWVIWITLKKVSQWQYKGDNDKID